MERSNLRLKPTFYSKTGHAWKCARSPKNEQQNLDLIFSLSTNLVGFFFDVAALRIRHTLIQVINGMHVKMHLSMNYYM